MATSGRLLRYLLLGCLSAAVLFSLLRFAHRKAVAGPEPALSETIPAQLPPPAPDPGQNGLPPCWVAPVPDSASAPAPLGRVEDCPVLIPGETKLNLIEVNLSTGTFLHVITDLFIPSRPPLAFTRVSRPVDEWSRKFSIFVPLLYDDFPVGTRNPYTYMDLITPDGQQFTYNRISPGTGYADARYSHEDTRTILYGSHIAWNGNGWNLTMRDGSMIVFPEAYASRRPPQGAVVGFRDAQGDQLRITRDGQGNLRRIDSQDGQWMEVRDDDLGHIGIVNDSRGESVQYFYDDLDRLSKVQSPDGTISYTYDAENRVVTLSKGGAMILRNDYDSFGRIVSVTFADGGEYQFDFATGPAGTSGDTTVRSPLGQSIELRIQPKSYQIVQQQ